MLLHLDLLQAKVDAGATRAITQFFFDNDHYFRFLEAVRALEEDVLLDIREGDVGAILGWGFAPWSGGPLSWLDMIGAAKAKEICDDLTARYGERFTTPALLNDMAGKEERFYGRFAPAEAA